MLRAGLLDPDDVVADVIAAKDQAATFGAERLDRLGQLLDDGADPVAGVRAFGLMRAIGSRRLLDEEHVVVAARVRGRRPGTWIRDRWRHLRRRRPTGPGTTSPHVAHCQRPGHGRPAMPFCTGAYLRSASLYFSRSVAALSAPTAGAFDFVDRAVKLAGALRIVSRRAGGRRDDRGGRARPGPRVAVLPVEIGLVCQRASSVIPIG